MSAELQIFGWTFDFSNPWLLTLSLGLLVSLLMSARNTWLRLARRAVGRWFVVLALNLVAHVSILFLLLMPTTVKQADASISLLTEGAPIADPNLAGVYAAPGYKRADLSLRDETGPVYLADVGQLLLQEPALKRLEVSGYGLNESEWLAFGDDIEVVFKPPALSGAVDIRWPRQLLLGEVLKITGRWRDRDQTEPTRLQLTDPAGRVVDEVRVRPGSFFSLAASPRTPGNPVYRLKAIGQPAMLESITVHVSVARPVVLMVRQSAPSFETRALKNWASTNGTTVIVHTQTSRERSISQQVNAKPEQENDFSPQTLARLNLLIMDGRTLAGLQGNHRQWLATAVNQGLGILVLADNDLLQAMDKLESGLLNGFELQRNPQLAAEELPYWKLTSAQVLGELALPATSIELKVDGGRVLLSNGNGRALSSMRTFGHGRVAVTTLRERHRWLTSGDRATYGRYWAMLMTSLARQRQQSFLLAPAENLMPEARSRVEICALGRETRLVVDIESLPDSGQTSLQLALPVDPLGSNRRCAWFFPPQPGWYQLTLHSSPDAAAFDTQNIYISRPDEWLSHKRWQRMQASNLRAARNPAPALQAGPAMTHQVALPIKPWWPWVFFILSAGALWLERKLDFDW